MGTRVNNDAVKHATKLIKEGKYTTDTDWSEAQPSADEENDFLDSEGWKNYSKWFLAIDTDASEETKDRYGFPIGDFSKIHRSGLNAAKQRAGQYDYDEIEKAADDLVKDIDKQEKN